MEQQIDLNHLREISGDDPEFERDLVDTFLQSAPDLIDRAATAVDQCDYVSLIHAAHTLKGSSRSIGARPLGQLSESLEFAARAADATACAAALDEVRTGYFLLQNVAESFVSRKAA